MSNNKSLLPVIIIVLLVLTFVWGIWYIGRMWNYTLSYESMVEETVQNQICLHVKEHNLECSK